MHGDATSVCIIPGGGAVERCSRRINATASCRLESRGGGGVLRRST